MADVTRGANGIGDLADQLQAAATGSAARIPDAGSLIGGLSMSTVIIGLVAGLVGSAYFVYGKRTQNFAMLFSGIALCVVPYLIGNVALLILACLAMMAVPFVI